MADGPAEHHEGEGSADAASGSSAEWQPQPTVRSQILAHKAVGAEGIRLIPEAPVAMHRVDAEDGREVLVQHRITDRQVDGHVPKDLGNGRIEP